MKKKLILMVLMVLPMICLMIFDFINITKYFSFTKSYDWLSFLGAYIAGVCTLVLGIVSIKQNKTLSDLNKKMLNNDVISANFSKIEIENDNFYEEEPLLPLDESYGIIMKENESDKTETNYHRFIIQLMDEKNLPLKSAIIKEMKFHYGSNKIYCGDIKSFTSNSESVKLEVTPHEDKTTYYLPICIVGDNELLNKISNSKIITIEAKIYIKNVFNVISEADYTIHFNKTNKKSENWYHCDLYGRKIYFKNVSYDDENN